MANKKQHDLIDRNAFSEYLEEIRQDYLEEDTLSSDFAAQVIETVQDEYLKNAETVDAVEVVRCKDCKYQCTDSCATWYEESGTYRDKWILINDNDFCSYGERRTEDGT